MLRRLEDFFRTGATLNKQQFIVFLTGKKGDENVSLVIGYEAANQQTVWNKTAIVTRLKNEPTKIYQYRSSTICPGDFLR